MQVPVLLSVLAGNIMKSPGRLVNEPARGGSTTTWRATMAGQGRAALFYGPGKPFELKEYAVPEPEPGTLVMKISVANVCGSDLHQWRGEFDVEKFGRPYPQILGHEMTGRVHTLGEGLTALFHPSEPLAAMAPAPGGS